MASLRTSGSVETEVEAKPGVETSPPVRPTLDPSRLNAAVEALLLTCDRAVAAGRASQMLIEAGLPEADASISAVRQAVEELNASYEASGRSFRIEAVAGGYRVMTVAEFAPVAAVVRGARENARLSRAAVETLSIIAYRQPITRTDIESIRGAATGEVLRTLLEKRLIAIVGRAEELGRPMLYGTSRRFLEVFGLASIRDLPPVGENFPATKASKPAPGLASAETHDADPGAAEDASGRSPGE